MANNPYLLKRLKEIEESVNLGTLDTTVIGLMIFVIATALALLSLGFPKLLVNQPYVLAGAVIFMVFVIPLIYFVFLYASSIIVKDGRFTNKIFIITYIFGLINFVGLVWIFLFIAWIYERWWITPSWITQIISVLLIVIAVLFTVFYTRPKISSYFKKNFKTIVKKRLNELKRKNGKNK